jgi:hypothetical protein
MSEAREGSIMTTERRYRLAAIVSVVAFSLAVTALAGCAQTSAVPAAGPTALGSLAAARSGVSTTAPDAKLLLVQTAQAVSPTGTPIWGFLFGSPTTDKVYMVFVAGGRSMGAQEYGKAGLSASEWTNVPSADAWKVDSDKAFAKALSISGATGAPKSYLMGLITYKPRTDTSTVEPFVWNVRMDPGTSGATKKTIEVNAMTGAAFISK